MRPIDGVLRSLGVVGLLIGLTFSCGNDTASDPGDDGDGSGGTDSGGTGGSDSGSGGSGDSGGSGGVSAGPSTTGGSITGAGGMSTAAGTTSATNVSTTGAAGAINVPETTPGLAEPCGSDDDCESDLICLAADSNSLVVGGPANGICTAPCGENDLCAADAACIIFDDTNSYCMPVCTPDNGVQDCAGRDDFVCDLLSVGQSCSTGAECPGGTSCLDQTDCVLPVCLPKCSADSQCPEGRFCDRAAGVCMDEAPEGKALNELCDEAANPDECLGFCGGGTAEEPRCAETCTLGVYPACGSESTEAGTADCLAPFVGLDDGDLGFCLGLCDCNADCPDEGMVCVTLESGGVTPPVQGRNGVCFAASEEIAEADILDTCE